MSKEQPDDGTSRCPLLCVAGLIGGTTGLADAASSNHNSSRVFRFSDGGAVGAGAARLVTNDAGATISVRTAELAAEPRTVWWVVFNHPEHCADAFAPGFQCGPGLHNPSVTAGQLARGGAL